MESTSVLTSPCEEVPFASESDLGTLANLIDADHPFWCGPDSMAAPHLPVGSPERAALFAILRKTFAEDWAAAARSVEQARREGLGDLYFVRVGAFIKIGRTTNFESRLRMITCHAPTKPEVLGIFAGAGYLERSFHRAFKRLRSAGEWFERSPEILAEIERLSNAE